MNKYIVIDSREKPKAIERIVKEFMLQEIPFVSSKLLFGDYMDWNKPDVVIDRKQNIAELAKNCTSEHSRFREELERAKAAGARLVILVEQNRYKDRDKWVQIKQVSDLMLWSSPYTTIRGEKVFRVLTSWMAKYDLMVEFCDKRSTGKRIIEIIYNEKNGK